MYVITGATGHTGKIIAQQLIQAGKPVRVTGRSADRLSELQALGAETAVGDLEDAAFVSKAFEGATAVYLLIPPKWDVADWRAYQSKLTDIFVQAIRENGVKKVVLLSSIGAHMPEGAGPVSGLYHLEKALEAIEGLDLLILRPGFFMENFYGNLDMIKQAGMFGYNLRADIPMALVHTRDIAEVAARHLLALDFTGSQIIYIGGAADHTMPEAAAIIGRAIGKPDLQYMQFPDEAARQGMVQAGMPQTIADGYVELFSAINSGEYLSDYKRSQENTTPTTFEEFVEKEFKYALS